MSLSLPAPAAARLPSLPAPGDRIVVVKGRKIARGAKGTVLATGSRRFGSCLSRWALVAWDDGEKCPISMDNLARL